MKKGFYLKLAMTGISKNRKMYFPYILTCVGMVMMFYIICFLSRDPWLASVRGGETMQVMLGMGTWITGIFAVIFLFYTNSFLIRRRKKEFGLYNMLEKSLINSYFTIFCCGGVQVSVPISILFFIMQKFYVEGITAGAVKG